MTSQPAPLCAARLLLIASIVCPPGAALGAAGTSGAQVQQSEPDSRLTNEVVRGITISTHRAGREWGEPGVVRPTLAKVRATGANWVALHPYARIYGDGTVQPADWPPQAVDQQIQIPLAEARKLGLKLMIKPHLAYWGSPFAWRGEIRFQSEEAWERFFTTYRDWIVSVARASAGVDAFAVGTELDGTTHCIEDWRRIIDDVRSVLSAPLTFASNWPEFERIAFWPALDAVGIQAYFPVSEDPHPSRQQIAEFWRGRMRSLSAFSRSVSRPILFTEIGYSRTASAATQPWRAGENDPQAEELQLRLLEGALRSIEREPTVLGAFLWKWFPEPKPLGRDFQAASPAVQRLLREVWEAPPLPPTGAARRGLRP